MTSSSAAENLSRGIVRRINNDGLGLVVECRGQFGLIKSPVRTAKLNESRSRAGDDRIRAVVLVERLEDDDFIAGIDHGQQHVDHAFGGSAADRDFAFRIDIDSQKAFCLYGQGIAELFRTPGDGVLVDVGENRIGGGLLQDFGRGKIRKPLR